MISTRVMHALKMTAACSVGVLLAGASEAQGVADANAAKTLAQTVCVHCHGTEGKNGDVAVPSIAGQQQAFLEVQLKTFRSQKNRDPDASHYMWGISSTWLMDDRLVTDISNYFASQAPAPGKSGSAAQIGEGRKIYDMTFTSPSLPACGTCHGANAEGYSVFPRLAGQHSEYLVRQMRMQRVGLHESQIHTRALGQLNDAQIDALAAYLNSR